MNNLTPIKAFNDNVTDVGERLGILDTNPENKISTLTCSRTVGVAAAVSTVLVGSSIGASNANAEMVGIDGTLVHLVPGVNDPFNSAATDVTISIDTLTPTLTVPGLGQFAEAQGFMGYEVLSLDNTGMGLETSLAVFANDFDVSYGYENNLLSVFIRQNDASELTILSNDYEVTNASFRIQRDGVTDFVGGSIMAAASYFAEPGQGPTRTESRIEFKDLITGEESTVIGQLPVSFNLSVSAIPEPSPVCALALLGVAYSLRRKKREPLDETLELVAS